MNVERRTKMETSAPGTDDIQEKRAEEQSRHNAEGKGHDPEALRREYAR